MNIRKWYWPNGTIPNGIRIFAEKLESLRGVKGGDITFVRRLLFRKHCGQRMFKVIEGDEWLTYLVTHKVCPNCGFSIQSRFFDRSGGVGIPFVTTMKDVQHP